MRCYVRLQMLVNYNLTLSSDDTVMQPSMQGNLKFMYICLKVFKFHIFQKRGGLGGKNLFHPGPIGISKFPES